MEASAPKEITMKRRYPGLYKALEDLHKLNLKWKAWRIDRIVNTGDTI